ncbi:MAG: twin-arginine translocation signal domain-containing protein, partial [Bradyrhizobium sp.]
MKRRDFIKLSAGFGAALAIQQSPALAQAKTVFKASDVHPLGYPTV